MRPAGADLALEPVESTIDDCAIGLPTEILTGGGSTIVRKRANTGNRDIHKEPNSQLGRSSWESELKQSPGMYEIAIAQPAHGLRFCEDQAVLPVSIGWYP